MLQDMVCVRTCVASSYDQSRSGGAEYSKLSRAITLTIMLIINRSVLIVNNFSEFGIVKCIRSWQNVSNQQ